MPGEFDLIDWIRRQQKTTPLVSLGVGDDLAVLRWPAEELLLVGVDQVIDRVHFDSAIHTPEQIGRKAMNRNLSDCAAMGCLPAAALIAVALPKTFTFEQSKALYSGIATAAEEFGCAVVGGDTGSHDGPLVVSVTIVGRSAGIAPVTRGGAKVGDGIFVSGALGGSILGRHMTFEPRVALGRELAGVASAMIDLSDGLSRDLEHICRASKVGAIIDADAIPIHPDAIALSQRDGRPPIEHALSDGEDYELLISAAASHLRNCTKIGQIVAGAGIQIRRNGKTLALSQKGWEHEIERKAAGRPLEPGQAI